tara:strand:- start:22318 stop:23472 length:1155 start_codon:yes stop_codon:yes gene_type:complete
MHTGNLHPYIGVISDCALQRHMIKKALSNYGLPIALSCDPANIQNQDSDKVEQVHCWILVLDNEDFESDAITALIEQTDIPILFGLGKAPNKYDELYISWERRLFSKLEELIGQVNIFESESSVLSLNHHISEPIESTARTDPSVFISQQRKLDEPTPTRPKKRASEIWVLAASLGGPSAVKRFLDIIPQTIKASFLYAQHIDSHFSHVLTQVLGRHAKLDLLALENDYPLYDGEVRVVPVDHEVRFQPDQAHITKNPWRGPYGPSIDHLLKNLMDGLGENFHLIVFSGMGNDSAMVVPAMQKAGCQIWTQSPETCASASMPQTIIDMQCSDYIDTPEGLAEALIKRVGCHPETDISDDISAPSNSISTEPDNEQANKEDSNGV